MSYNEADTRAKLITPAILKSGWTEADIRREETPGPVEKVNGRVRRSTRKKVDYVLRLPVQHIPVAFIEAKKEDAPPGSGLEQVKGYQSRFHVPFVYSSNGHRFIEYDGFTGLAGNAQPMEAFPSPEDLRRRYEEGNGFTLDSDAARPLLTPYARGETGENTRRYYQDAAIRAVLEAAARGEKRMLLSMATGTGKTRVAVDLIKRIADAGHLKRVLFVCDRTELRNQARAAFSNEFGDDAAEVKPTRDGGNNAANARIHIATYQTLGTEEEEGENSFLIKNYPEGHFSHIIIDECHRSAWGRWRGFLERNPDAVHIGLTATPRRLKIPKRTEDTHEDERLIADNRRYFGEPVYEYPMAQAMEDGYLALCEIQMGRVDLDMKGISLKDIMERRPVDLARGHLLTEDEVKEKYEKGEFEKAIMLPDRVRAMCWDLFNYLKEDGGPEQKTVIFCAGDYHAQMVTDTMNNFYAKWCTEQGERRRDPYAFKCTASADGNARLSDFRGSRHHFIATTVDLLSTGVDVPCLRNVVFFRYVKSPISFHQMLGRGTRIDEKTGKLSFTVYDYTGATDLLGEDTPTVPKEPGEGGEGEEEPPPPIEVEGFEVHVAEQGRFIVGKIDGRPVRLTVEEYTKRLREHLKQEVSTIEELRARWLNPAEREALIVFLKDKAYPAEALQAAKEMYAYDLYDVLREAVYGLAPLTRRDRADDFQEAHKGWLEDMHEAGGVVHAMAEQFAEGGMPELEESRSLFDTPAVRDAGGAEALEKAGDAAGIVQETKKRILMP